VSFVKFFLGQSPAIAVVLQFIFQFRLFDIIRNSQTRQAPIAFTIGSWKGNRT
jgi:hypothetical protein